MSDSISLNTLESIPAQVLAGGMEARQQNRDRQGAHGGGAADSVTLSPDAERQVQKLRERDREVRAHEQAHIAAGGQHVSGGACFSYQAGPDGRQYAVGGSVQIDVSPVPGNPEATEEKARVVRRAALAPASPSAADRNVAAKASAMESKARSEQDGLEGARAAESSDGADGVRRRAADAYARLASPFYGASWQSSAGNGPRSAAVNPDRPWPGPAQAAAIYAANLPQTGLAPWGTGISLFA